VKLNVPISDSKICQAGVALMPKAQKKLGQQTKDWLGGVYNINERLIRATGATRRDPAGNYCFV
jgi:hypothetical protein